MKLIWLSFLAAFLAASPVQAAQWFPLVGASDVEVHVDTDSVASAGSGLTKAWVRHSYTESRKSRGYPAFDYQSSIQLYVFNCPERTLGVLQDAFYSGEFGQGENVDSNSYNRKNVPFSDVIPGTIGEGTLNFVCNWAKRKAKK